MSAALSLAIHDLVPSCSMLMISLTFPLTVSPTRKANNERLFKENEALKSDNAKFKSINQRFFKEKEMLQAEKEVL